MPAPSKLSILARAVVRLDKDVKGYETELSTQTATVEKLQKAADAGETIDKNGNDEYILKQNISALDETKKVIPTVKKRRDEQLQKLKELLDTVLTNGSEPNQEDVQTVRDLIARLQPTSVEQK